MKTEAVIEMDRTISEAVFLSIVASFNLISFSPLLYYLYKKYCTSILHLDPEKILILAPHTDDGELGCGGSIARFIAAGKQVCYAAFCLCSSTLPEGYAPDTLEKECRAATGLLGIASQDLFLFNYEVRELTSSRQKILQELIDLNKKIRPDLVLLPGATDIHQDHQVIFQEGQRAFKNTSFAGYELPWNNFSIHTNFFISLSESDLEKKISSLNAYGSQSHRNYMQPGFIRSLARVRGVQANTEYAEAFEIYRLFG